MKPAINFDHIRHEGYRNINEVEPCDKRLHNMETLFGDKNAKILILLQDAAHYERFVELKKTGTDIFRHGENVLTNKRLVNLFKDKFPSVDIRGNHASTCGLFGANAVWLLKTGHMSSPIKTIESVLVACEPVFKETVLSLPKLNLIVAFGRVAFESLNYYLKVNKDWKNTVVNREVHHVKYLDKSFAFTGAVHPAARGKYRDQLSPHEKTPWVNDLRAWWEYSNSKN